MTTEWVGEALLRDLASIYIDEVTKCHSYFSQFVFRFLTQ